MELNCKKTEEGLSITYENKEYSLSYPKNIWKKYPDGIREVLIDNLVHLLTMNLPLVSGIKKLKYNTARPVFKPFFDTVVINSLPGAVEDYDIQTEDIIKHFLNVEYEFDGHETKFPQNYTFNPNEKAVVSLSCGKDSLLSLAVCNEIGLNPISIYINDTVSPSENKIKMEFGKKVCDELDTEFHIVRNEIENLNDFVKWDSSESLIGYTHMLTGFCMIVLPFLHNFQAKYIVLGNQKNMEFRFHNKNGFFSYPSFDQSTRWMRAQDSIAKFMTDRKASVMSVIEPLTNIAIMRVLQRRYGKIGKYEVSCDDLDGTTEIRWCHECSKCARLSLMLKANKIDVKKIGFRENLLEKNHKELYCLFDGKEVGCYEKSNDARDEQLLAFYMAYRNGEKGYLIDLFKEKFLKEAKSREDDLIKKFFSIHKSVTMPGNIREKVFSIYKEEMKNLF